MLPRRRTRIRRNQWRASQPLLSLAPMCSIKTAPDRFGFSSTSEIGQLDLKGTWFSRGEEGFKGACDSRRRGGLSCYLYLSGLDCTRPRALHYTSHLRPRIVAPRLSCTCMVYRAAVATFPAPRNTTGPDGYSPDALPMSHTLLASLKLRDP